MRKYKITRNVSLGGIYYAVEERICFVLWSCVAIFSTNESAIELVKELKKPVIQA